MKKINYLFFMLFGLLFIFPKITNAEVITNYNGIIMSEQEYNNFLKIYDEDYVMHMSEEKYNKLKGLNFDDNNITKATKYIETTYNQSLQLVTEREITKEEYNNYGDNSISPRLDSGAASYETQVKKIVMSIIGGSTWNSVTTIVTWKGIPSTRSFDVIGVRMYGGEVGEGSQSGEQIYTLDGEYTIIEYSWKGTNIKKFDNGYGISMNIVNSDITSLQLMTECEVTPTIEHPTVYTAYQHAIDEVSLATSQNYTLGGAGLGGVFVYPYNISIKYDGMSGVYVAY